MIRRTPTRPLASLVAAAALAASSPGTAANKAPVSALPLMPAPRDRSDPPKDYGVAGMTVKEIGDGPRVELVAATSRGYCIADTKDGLSLSSSTTSTDDEELELWRLVETDGKATFERTRFEVAGYLRSPWVKSKTSIELRAVTSSNGVTVWGFRHPNGDVVLLARGAASGREVPGKKSEEDGSFDLVSSDCAFGAARLSASAVKAGSLAQLRGSLPPVGEGKAKVVPHFVVDGSMAKLSRDPEPMLAVRVRRLE